MESQVEKDLKGPNQTIYSTLEQRLISVFTKDKVTLLIKHLYPVTYAVTYILCYQQPAKFLLLH